MAAQPGYFYILKEAEYLLYCNEYIPNIGLLNTIGCALITQENILQMPFNNLIKINNEGTNGMQIISKYYNIFPTRA